MDKDVDRDVNGDIDGWINIKVVKLWMRIEIILQV